MTKKRFFQNLNLFCPSSLSRVHPPLDPLTLQTQAFLTLLWTPSLPVCLSHQLSVCLSDSIVSRLGVTNGLPQSGQQLCESL